VRFDALSNKVADFLDKYSTLRDDAIENIRTDFLNDEDVKGIAEAEEAVSNFTDKMLEMIEDRARCPIISPLSTGSWTRRSTCSRVVPRS
jgi:hypothetical protein